MKQWSGRTFPNGVPKSRLLETFLSLRDFGCEPEQYTLDIAIAHKQEAAGDEICRWHEDQDGTLVVSGLALSDPAKRVAITSKGFDVIAAVVRVFISYAKEDYEAALRLHDDLKAVGVSPWIDQHGLRAGEPWRERIEVEIRSANYFVALLSHRSLGKRGFVQKELRYALDVLEEIPPGRIFLIPARLDGCRPTHRALASLHWVDLFPDWDVGVGKIVQALSVRDA